MVYGAEAMTDGIYRTVTRTRYNAAGNPLVSVQKSLVSNLSDALESKNLTTDERNLTSTQWIEYHNGTKRKSYNTLPTSDITAEAVSVGGFTLSQTDNVGVTTTAGRTLTVTDAQGNTSWCRYDVRGYLQITCCDLNRSNHPALWFITWEPTQPIATRPLAIQKDGTWYSAPARLASQDSRSQECSRLGGSLLKSHPAYGWDLTKNICELYGTNGYIRTTYTYTPYGEVTESTNSIYQPIQWSSEYNDTELGMVYYNYRHYNPVDGRWLGRDKLEQNNMYIYINNTLPNGYDYLGNDRGIIAFNLENLIHYTLVIDEWFIENGKYKRSGYFHYDFRPLSTFDNIRTTLWSVANVSICYIHSFGVVEKTHTWNKIETFSFKKTTPCNDIALMKELDKEIGEYMYYNVLVRNCISWTLDAYYSKDDNSKCCNPDGTLYEE